MCFRSLTHHRHVLHAKLCYGNHYDTLTLLRRYSNDAQWWL